MVELTVIGSNLPALVDDDFSFLRKYRWRLHKKGFVYRHGDRVIKLARVIMHLVSPEHSVRHLNGSRLDCRRDNLRVIDADERNQNPPLRKSNRSGARGVYYDKTRGQFVAAVRHDGRNYFFGRFDTFKEAAAAVTRERPKILPHLWEVHTSALSGLSQPPWEPATTGCLFDDINPLPGGSRYSTKLERKDRET